MKWILPAALLFAALLFLAYFLPHSKVSTASSSLSVSDSSSETSSPSVSSPTTSSNSTPARVNIPVVMYDNNNHAERDYADAVEWLRQGAEAGNVDAQINLGNLYASGSGVPQTPTEAYYWLFLATRHGHHVDAEETRDRVAKQLDAGQRAEAERRAAAFTPKISK